jgi:hypothetical protein
MTKKFLKARHWLAKDGVSAVSFEVRGYSDVEGRSIDTDIRISNGFRVIHYSDWLEGRDIKAHLTQIDKVRKLLDSYEEAVLLAAEWAKEPERELPEENDNE